MRCEPPPLNIGSFLVFYGTKVVAEGTVTRYLNRMGENSTALNGQLNAFSIGSNLLMHNILVPNTTVRLSLSGSAERILTGKPGEWKAEFTGTLLQPAHLCNFISILTGTATIKMHRVIYPDDSSKWTMSELSLASDAQFGRIDGTGFSTQARVLFDLYGSRTDRSYYLRTSFVVTVSDVGLMLDAVSPGSASGLSNVLAELEEEDAGNGFQAHVEVVYTATGTPRRRAKSKDGISLSFKAAAGSLLRQMLMAIQPDNVKQLNSTRMAIAVDFLMGFMRSTGVGNETMRVGPVKPEVLVTAAFQDVYVAENVKLTSVRLRLRDNLQTVDVFSTVEVFELLEFDVASTFNTTSIDGFLSAKGKMLKPWVPAKMPWLSMDECASDMELERKDGKLQLMFVGLTNCTATLDFGE